MRGRRAGTPRCPTRIEDGRVYVEGPDGPVEVGALERIVAAVGGPAWEIGYSDWQRERYPDLDTSDEGLVVDVGDVVRAMEHEPSFVRALAACPATAPDRAGRGAGGVGSGPRPGDGDELSPRAGLFVGRLFDRLQCGLE